MIGSHAEFEINNTSREPCYHIFFVVRCLSHFYVNILFCIYKCYNVVLLSKADMSKNINYKDNDIYFVGRHIQRCSQRLTCNNTQCLFTRKPDILPSEDNVEQ